MPGRRTIDVASLMDEFAQKLAARAPAELLWPANSPLVRCHHNRWGPAEFYAGDPARFSPFVPVTATARSAPVKVLYGSDSEVGALSETVFRDLPVSGRKSIARRQLRQRNLSTLITTRELHLADLTGHGLRRLRLTRKRIIESDRRSYPETALLAQAVHGHSAHFDGIIWVSRQHDRSRALVLFAGRVADKDIDTSEVVPTFPLDFGHGRELVDRIADDIGITIVEA